MQWRIIAFVQPVHLHSGTTLLLAVIEDRTSTMWVANVGDSRGVMSSEGDLDRGRGSLVVPLSYDHKPTQVTTICPGL